MAVTLGVDFAFASTPMASSFTWTSLDTRVKSFAFSRGRSNERNQMEAGTGTTVLMDNDRYLDPDYTSSPYYPNVKPTVPVRVLARVVGASTNLMLTQQFVERLPRARIAPKFAERSVGLSDGFTLLSQAGLAGATFAQQSATARVGAVLTAVGWPAGRRSISSATGDTVQQVTFAEDDSTTALAHLQAVADSEHGLFWIDRSGNAHWLTRTDLLYSGAGTSVATFTDVPGTGGYGYTDAQYSYDADLVSNDWIGSRPTNPVIADDAPATQEAIDATSVTNYGLRTQQFQSLATTDPDVLAAVQFRLSEFKDPLQRFEAITVYPGTNETLWGILCQLEIGDAVTVVEHLPTPTSAASSNVYLVQGINVTYPGGALATTSWKLTLWKRPATVSTNFMTLDSTTLGKFGATMGYLRY